MKASDFWIGDAVIDTSLGIAGILSKSEPDYAIVKSKSIEFKCQWRNLLPDTPSNRTAHNIHASEKKREKAAELPTSTKVELLFPESIDLHIATLEPDRVRDMPSDILRFQLAACRKYLEKAIALRKDKVILIHGKGEGKLKDAVHQILDELETDLNYSLNEWKYNGGATDVYFNFT